MTRIRNLLTAAFAALLSVRIFMPLMMSTALTLAVAGPLGLQALDARNAAEAAPEPAVETPTEPADEPVVVDPPEVESEPAPAVVDEVVPDLPEPEPELVFPTTSRRAVIPNSTTSRRPTTTTRSPRSTTTVRPTTTTATTTSTITATTTSITSTTTTTTVAPPPLNVAVVPVGGLEPGREGLIGITITGGISGSPAQFPISTTFASVVEALGGGWTCGTGVSTTCSGPAPGAESITVFVRVAVTDSATSVTVDASGSTQTISARSGQLAARFATQSPGSVAMIGNQQLTCPSSKIIASITCPMVQERSAQVPSELKTNNRWAMTLINADSRGGVNGNSNSTGATLGGSGDVLFAGLYWGATTASPTLSKVGTVKFGTPISTGNSVPDSDSDYISIKGSELTNNGSDFQVFADVTGLVRAAGAGTYWVADMVAAPGSSNYGGWSLVVVRSSSSDKDRDMIVFDGYAQLTPTATKADITIGGFSFPARGGAAQLGLVAYEGESDLGPDGASIDGRPISNASNPATDVFNSTISRLGSLVTDRFPAHQNTLGFDIDTFDVSSVLKAGSTSAGIALTTVGDTYAIGVATITVDR